MRYLESKVFKTWLSEDKICCTEVKPGAVIFLDDAIENSEMVKRISNEEIYPLLVDMRNIKSIDKAARDYFSMRQRVPGVKAIGMLVKSPVSKVVGNFFLGLNRPIVPTQLFTSEKKALDWLKCI